MELGNHIDALVAAGTGIATTFIAYLRGKGDAKSTELDNVSKAITIWQDTATNLEEQLKEVDIQMKVLKENHEKCEASKVELTKRVDELNQKVTKLEKKK
jgi:septal ring factor EnvC (AmiA/AmiB activator)